MTGPVIVVMYYSHLQDRGNTGSFQGKRSPRWRGGYSPLVPVRCLQGSACEVASSGRK